MRGWDRGYGLGILNPMLKSNTSPDWCKVPHVWRKIRSDFEEGSIFLLEELPWLEGRSVLEVHLQLAHTAP